MGTSLAADRWRSRAHCRHFLARPGLCQSRMRNAIDTIPRMAEPTVPSPSPSGVKILAVDQDEQAARVLQRQLSELGYSVVLARDGRSATEAIVAQDFDLVLLERILPGADGVELVRWMRREGIATPVILLTVLGRLAERVEGLESGADDYITKPAEIEELNARIRVQLRRLAPPVEDRATISAGDIVVSLAGHRAFRAGKAIDLQKTELNLLAELVRNAGTVLTRDMLLERVWNQDALPTTNIVDAYIRRLRVKLGLPDPIQTIRGVGYKIQD